MTLYLIGKEAVTKETYKKAKADNKKTVEFDCIMFNGEGHLSVDGKFYKVKEIAWDVQGLKKRYVTYAEGKTLSTETIPQMVIEIASITSK